MEQSGSISAELIVIGPEADQYFRRHLINGQTIRIGRAPKDGWTIPWEPRISREHADLLWENERLQVRCLETAKNPIHWRNKSLREIIAVNGDMFRIGQTKFQLVAQTVASDNSSYGPAVKKNKDRFGLSSARIRARKKPDNRFMDSDDISERQLYTFDLEDLKKVSFGDTVKQLEVLSVLPELISLAKSDVDLALMLVGQLLHAIPTAVAAAVVQFDELDAERIRNSGQDIELPSPINMRVQTRESFSGRFTPSRRLLLRVLQKGQSVMHIAGESESDESRVTMNSGLSWAFCTPVNAANCAGWCLYVAGEGAREGVENFSRASLTGDLRFTKLVSQFLGSVLSVKSLQQQKTQLSSFFSPNVIDGLTRKTRSVLEPSEREITVLFCDVQGFSRKSELLQNHLFRLLESGKAALGAMTKGILDFDGSVADFQGDAALGFWGWPVVLDDGPIKACRAALAIQRLFAIPNELMEGFRCGIGIAHGRAIAGQIGTAQQAKIGVFGPVVNQGSRLEGLTRQFGVSICVDEKTAAFIRRRPDAEGLRVRRLARVRPKGMDIAVQVHQLFEASDAEFMNDDAISIYESALDDVVCGEWQSAIEKLRSMPKADGPTRFVLEQLALSGFRPPEDWDGAFALRDK